MGNDYVKKAERYVETVSDMNEIIEYAKQFTKIIDAPDKIQGWDKSNKELQCLDLYSWVYDKKVRFEFTTQYSKEYYGQAITFVLRKDGQVTYDINPYEAYSRFQHVERCNDISELVKRKNIYGLFWDDEKNHVYQSAKPLLWVKYEQSENYIYEYDLNSAYASILTKYIPDTTKPRMHDIVKPGECGFYIDDDLTSVEVGDAADIVFPLMPSPYKDLVVKLYNDKKKAEKGTKEYEVAKQTMNLAVGYWQIKNPFLRAWVVNSCNSYMQSLIDDNTVMVNTDAIYSIKPRTDLIIGRDIGQFKLEEQGVMKNLGFNYSINDKPHVRGVPLKFFETFELTHGRKWDIFTDPNPITGNTCVYDYEKKKLVVIDYEI